MPDKPIKAIVDVSFIANDIPVVKTLLHGDDEIIQKIQGTGVGRKLLLTILAAGAVSTFNSMERAGQGSKETHCLEFLKTVAFYMHGGKFDPLEMLG